MNMQTRDGFALPVAIFVIGFLTVGVAAAFTRVESEARTNRDRDATIDAYSVAQSGLEYYLTNRRALGLTQFPPPAQESVRVNVPGGYADVITNRVRQENGAVEALYHVRSRSTAVRGTAAGTPPAQRTVTQFTLFRRENLHVTGAWTSLSGLQKNGTAGTISGVDNCGVKADVAGIAVPTGLWDSDNGNFVPEGTPPVLSMGTKEEMADAIKIDWDAIINEGAIQPDLVVPSPDAWPGSAAFADEDFWPVIRINGNFSVPTDGQGTLIVTGNLVINGSEQWRGIVLVGGMITSDGNNTVEGTVISGLNEQLGMTVGESAIGNGQKTYVYDSCSIDKALNRIAVLRTIPGTWSDNWAW